MPNSKLLRKIEGRFKKVNLPSKNEKSTQLSTSSSMNELESMETLSDWDIEEIFRQFPPPPPPISPLEKEFPNPPSSPPPSSSVRRVDPKLLDYLQVMWQNFWSQQFKKAH